jgi:hypothetical protein
MSYRRFKLICLVVAVIALPSLALGQATEFTYQGQMQSGGAAANGNFDLEFALFDAAAGGSQVGSTLARSGVAVTNGIFAVNLDFGQSFTGASRFLEVRVRPAGGGAFTTLSPRQPVGSSPYSIRSLLATNADNATTAANISNPLGGDVTGSQSNTTVARLRGRNVAANQPSNGQVLKFNSTTSQWEPANDETGAGGGNAILNQTTPQVNANFNITGTGTAGILAATSQFNLGVNRVLFSDPNVLAVGVGAGSANTTGNRNTFVGGEAGQSTSSGGHNTFFGARSGRLNTIGGENSFYGSSAGGSNTTGAGNSFFGSQTGSGHTTGFSNSFFGLSAGGLTTTGDSNSFFGGEAGIANETGSRNTALGRSSNLGADNLTNATAIGAFSLVTQSDSLVLGSINGVNGAIASTNVGIGTTAPTQRLHVVGNGLFTGNLNVNGTLTAPGFVVPGGSSNYIQNTTTPQASSNFSISGNGTAAGFLAAGSQFNIGTRRVLHQPSANSIGILGGPATSSGDFNVIVGSAAGASITSGQSNTFVGNLSGPDTTTGGENVFVGSNTGVNNAVGARNVLVGSSAELGGLNLTNATAIGNRAFVSQSNSLVLGSINGINGSGANTNVGIGTPAPTQRLHVVGNSLFAGDLTVTGTLNGTLPAGSPNYIQNTITQQTLSNFNISGGGTAATFNATSDFRIGGVRMLHAPGTQNTFLGANAGVTAPAGTGNSYFGSDAGRSTTSGSSNSFFGSNSGELNTTGSSNSFFGVNSGDANTGGSENSFFGHASGGGNTTGNQNSAFGRNAGQLNTTGNENAYFGFGAGQSATTSFNSFFGSKAGQFNTTGGSNSFFGASAGLGNNSGSDNSFFGVNAGVANQAGGGNSYFGRRAGRDSLGSSNTAVGIDAGRNNTTGSSNTFIGAGADAGSSNLSGATAIGAGATVNDNNEIVLGTENNFVRIKGVLFIPGSDGLDFRSNLTTLGDTHVCLVGRTPPLTFSLTRCASSIRFKENVYSFGDGLRVLQQLRPVAYTWKSTGVPAIGLIAEEVNEVEPRLAQREPDGEVFGVKFDSVTAVAVSAVQEQQIQIEAQRSKIDAQQKQIKKQEAEINELKIVVCSIRPRAAICKK